MGITVETSSIYAGEREIRELAADVNGALKYLDEHIDGSQTWVKGALMDALLDTHSEYVKQVDGSLVATRKCLLSVSSGLGDVGRRYDQSEVDAQVSLQDIFRSLNDGATLEPITATTPRGPVRVSEPSGTLAVPTSVMSDPAFVAVWSVLSWPDYLSISYWLRQVLKQVVNIFWPQTFRGMGVFEFLASELGGEWDRVAIAGNAFGYLGGYFKVLSQSVHDAGVDVLAGWSEGSGSHAAGEYFAGVVAAFEGQTQVYADLETKYTNAAWAAFGSCQALLSAVDALCDAVIVAQMTGKTILEVLAAPFTGGATAPLAVGSAVVALIEALSAAWGVMMTATSATLAVGAGLGSARQQIEFLPLPEA